MAPSKLSRLQQDALAGFYIQHREPPDLDLFTLDDVLDDGVALLAEIARKFKASLNSIQASPDFRRFLIRHGEEALVVDLVRDRGVQTSIHKAGSKRGTVSNFATRNCSLSPFCCQPLSPVENHGDGSG